MYVIGTAGHIDHGKTTLVKAITGIDTDRLSEEKSRGLSIDLGFAWIKLPSGIDVSFVDVPGHKKFISNMLAGVGAIDLALIVIAADESVMPQTLEHFEILNLLGIQKGIIVLTKCDLVDKQWLELVRFDVEKMLAGSDLENAKVVEVSAVSSLGIQELITEIEIIINSTNAKMDIGKPRLWVDRSFSMSGFGAVITGTLLDGNLTVGQDVQLVLSSQTSRIRGLQVHNQIVEMAKPGERVAVNLAGIDHELIQRGDVLSTEGLLKTSMIVDVSLKVLDTYPNSIKHNMAVTIHTGTNECIARIKLIDIGDLTSGDTGYVQLKFDRPLVVSRGDYFVIRTNMFTVGGGTVLDLNPKRHKRGDFTIIQRLKLISDGSFENLVKVVLEDNQPAEFEVIEKHIKIGRLDLQDKLNNMVASGKLIAIGNNTVENSIILTLDGWHEYMKTIMQSLQEYHCKFPLRIGIPRAELRQALNLSPKIFNLILHKLGSDKIIEETNKFVLTPGYKPILTVRQSETIDSYLMELNQKKYSPSSDIKIDDDILVLLENQMRVVRISESIVYPYEVYCAMVEQIKTHLKSFGEISVAEVRDIFGASRKYALALMEYLDTKRVTKRIGDKRILF